MDFFRLPLSNNDVEFIDYKDNSFPLGFWYDDYDLLKGKMLPCHWHQAVEISILLSGTLDYIVNGISYPMAPGDCIFVNSNQMHRTRSRLHTEKTLVFGLVFDLPLFGSSSEVLLYRQYLNPILHSPVPAAVLPADSETGAKIGTSLQQLRQLSKNDYFFELDSFSLLLRIWKEILLVLNPRENEHAGTPRLRHADEVKEMLFFIKSHYQEKITIDDLIVQTNLNRSECFRSFKSFTGMPPTEFINEYRLTQAAGLLGQTELSMTEVAASCGFNSSSYFGKLFQKRYGMTPLKYQKFLRTKYRPSVPDKGKTQLFPEEPDQDAPSTKTVLPF